MLLVALGDEENLQRAAAVLRMAQPAASRLLRGMERMLGLSLFERLPRGMRPTVYGEAMIRHARVALGSLITVGSEIEAHEEFEEPAPVPAEASDFITDLRKSGIDTDAGLKYCVGDKDFYKSLLIQFASEAADKIASMKKYHSLKDWHNYEILVHALKSTSKMIGIYDLSEKAKSLETAAKNNDETYILGNHEAMIRDYDDITAVIREQLITGAPDDDGDVLEFAPEENGGDKV
jgi:HPt (histidine-containing phosphotransfer) domain-containing protein